MTDPEFLRLGGPTLGEMRQAIIWPNFCQKLHEIKEVGQGGACLDLLDLHRQIFETAPSPTQCSSFSCSFQEILAE